jgi:hypothetical protein
MGRGRYGIKIEEERGEGNVPRKPAKAGRNDFAAAGIVGC